MSDASFIERLRNTPAKISLKEFEEKAIFKLVNIQNYDLLLEHRITDQVLAAIISLRNETAALQDTSLLDCDIENQQIARSINRIYSELRVEGLWATGASKIAHLLNNQLLPPISVDIARHFGIQYKADVMPWLQRMKWDIQEAVDDYSKHSLTGTPNQYLSERLGYSKLGYEKSQVKFADEYYWLCFGECLPIPPKWIPTRLEENSEHKF